jgi:hypothetical protein
MIGKVSPSVDVKVRLCNLATGRVDYLDVQSDSAGEVWIDFRPLRHRYEVHVFDSTGQPMMIQIDSTTAECLHLMFEVSHHDTAHPS